MDCFCCRRALAYERCSRVDRHGNEYCDDCFDSGCEITGDCYLHYPLCDMHGGAWGDDPGCFTCVTNDGVVRDWATQPRLHTWPDSVPVHYRTPRNIPMPKPVDEPSAEDMAYVFKSLGVNPQP